MVHVHVHVYPAALTEVGIADPLRECRVRAMVPCLLRVPLARVFNENRPSVERVNL